MLLECALLFMIWSRVARVIGTPVYLQNPPFPAVGNHKILAQVFPVARGSEVYNTVGKVHHTI
jgi:hypothetical protein